MSDVIQTNPTPVGEFQAHFGSPPGAQDPKAECEKWERLCAELLAEREQLRAELARAQAEQEKAVLRVMFAEFESMPKLTMAEIYAQVDRETSMDDIIADLHRELEASNE